MKTHNDHVATCLCCANFELLSESGPYSDVTPGDPAQMCCRLNMFEICYDPGPDDIHAIFPLAQTCDKYEPRG